MSDDLTEGPLHDTDVFLTTWIRIEGTLSGHLRNKYPRASEDDIRNALHDTFVHVFRSRKKIRGTTAKEFYNFCETALLRNYWSIIRQNKKQFNADEHVIANLSAETDIKRLEDLDELAERIASIKTERLRVIPPPPILLGDFIGNCLQYQWIILPSEASTKKKQIKASEAALQMKKMGYKKVSPQTVSDLFQRSVRLLRQSFDAD